MFGRSPGPFPLSIKVCLGYLLHRAKMFAMVNSLPKIERDARLFLREGEPSPLVVVTIARLYLITESYLPRVFDLCFYLSLFPPITVYPFYKSA